MKRLVVGLLLALPITSFAAKVVYGNLESGCFEHSHLLMTKDGRSEWGRVMPHSISYLMTQEGGLQVFSPVYNFPHVNESYIFRNAFDVEGSEYVHPTLEKLLPVAHKPKSRSYIVYEKEAWCRLWKQVREMFLFECELRSVSKEEVEGLKQIP